jgi:hypothetical protein
VLVRIDTINAIIWLVICIFIDLVAHLKSFTLHNPVENRRAVQHIDFIVEPAMPKMSDKFTNLAISLPQNDSAYSEWPRN